MVEKVKSIWLDGELVAWEDAQVHVLTHTLHYGLGAFEGIRCYQLEGGGSGIFRLQEHIRRLFDSCRIATIEMDRWSPEDVARACVDTVRSNGLEDCYIRPLVFLGDGTMGLAARNNRTRLAVITWSWHSLLGAEGLEKGIRAKVSSFTRPGVNMLMSKGKICGHYVNSILANREVRQAGYDEAILLDAQGYLSEGAAENVFVVRDDIVSTPPEGASLLGGITRNTVIRLAHHMGLTIRERAISRDELYTADEIFVVGTAAEVTPVREVDDRPVGKAVRGPITERIQARYFEVVRGVQPPDEAWISRI